MDNKWRGGSVLVFGAGPLQRSILARSLRWADRVYAVDPDEKVRWGSGAVADRCFVVDGQDYGATVALARRLGVRGVVTSATDKPIVMMARVAQALSLPSITVETARISTDKYLMKQRFQACDIPCARGVEVASADEAARAGFPYPVVLKPVDNSGSRGVVICPDEPALRRAWPEVLSRHTHRNRLLVEEYIGGREYSVEALHMPDGLTRVVQVTEKTTTHAPYNVEVRHIQPAPIFDFQRAEICKIVAKIGTSFGFRCCASHTELKITPEGQLRVIETSPRLGGDYINSRLTPLSTGVNIEDCVVRLGMGYKVAASELTPDSRRCAGILFFNFPPGSVVASPPTWPDDVEGVEEFYFDLRKGERVPLLTESASRYGHVVVEAPTYGEVARRLDRVNAHVSAHILPPPSVPDF